MGDKVTNLKFKEGGEKEALTTQLEISVVTNGWIVSAVDDEDMESTEVFSFDNPQGLLACIQEHLGFKA